MTVSLVIAFATSGRSSPSTEVESKTTPNTPSSFPVDERGMRYPNPGGWIFEGGTGKTRLTTPTVVEGLCVRCGRGEVVRREESFRGGMVEMTWEVWRGCVDGSEKVI
jgi:hypothetical protein